MDDKADFIKLQAFAPNTLKTRRSQWNRYHHFCKDFSLAALPVTAQTVCRFLVHINDDLSYTSLNNYVSALNSLGKFYDSDFDLRKDYAVILLLRGFKRLKGDISTPKDPLLPADLKAIFQHVDFTDLLQYTVWIIVLLAFRSLLRKSHFVCTSPDDQNHLLRVRDVSFEPWGCSLKVNSSKTIQFGQRSFDIPLSYSNTPLCVVTLLKDYLAKFPKPDSDFLFTLPTKKGSKPVPYTAALDLLKTWSTQAGLAKDIGFHSLRRGAATYMHSLNFGLVSIQKAGDWRSLCVLDYLTIDYEERKRVESLLSSSL